MADQNFRVKHGISIDTDRLVDVNKNINAGVTTFTHTKITGVTTVGIISATNGQGGMGIVTFQSAVAIESGSNRITIQPPSANAGFVSSYTLTLPPKPGTDGQVLTYGPDGRLGFTTTGLFENRYYVSSINGDDNLNDGRSKPFRTIKKAAQAASFRSFNLPGGEYLDAGNLLTLNSTFIQEEVVAYLQFNFPNITTDKPDYDPAKCKRDIGYIIDAIAYDLSYGGNSKSIEAGLAYWEGGVSYVDGEETEALFAYNYIKFIAQYVINNQSPPTLYQTTVAQTFDFSILDDVANVNSNYFHRSKDARNLIVGNRQEIIDRSLAQVAFAHSDFYFPGDDPSNERSRYYDSYRLIQQNRDTIINYAYAGIASAYPAFVNPDPNKCQRDIGYFIDAVSTDVFTGGNVYSREFTLKYFDGNGNPITNGLSGEEQQSIYAFRYAGNLMREAITNQLPIKDLTVTADPVTGSNTSASSCSNVQSTITTLVGIVTVSIGAGTTVGLGTTNPGYFKVDKDNNVVDNSGTFVVGIGSTNVRGGRKCARDLGYIVDAIAQDVSYGTNQHIIYATKQYFDGAGNPISNGLVSEESQSITAFQAASEYAKKAITNQLYYQDLNVIADSATGFNTSPNSCANTQSQITTLVGILTAAISSGSLANIQTTNLGITDCADVRSAIVNYVGIVTAIIGIGTTASPEVDVPSTLSKPIAIIVEAGEYLEDNPIILYEDIAVIGDNLRNTIIRPQNAGKDLFRVRNGCYVTGFAMKDFVDQAGIPKYTFDWAIAFDDPLDQSTSRVGYAVKTSKTIIHRSPYIQNCSILSFLGGNGIYVDGSKVQSPNTPVIKEEAELNPDNVQPEQGKSMVAAAFTMVSFGGIGWRVVNNGYSQVVSCFQIFCRYGSLTQSGGYLSITNSATNFGFFALRSSGFSESSFIFDRGIIAATGTSGGDQTLRTIGLGRTEQDLYVTRFIDGSGADRTTDFKPVVTQQTFQPTVGLNTVTDKFTIVGHPFLNGDTILYIGDENSVPPRVIEGMVSSNQYYLGYIDENNFNLYEDEALSKLVDTKSLPIGINTFQKGNVEFFAQEIIDTHNSYQILNLESGISPTPTFISGRLISQPVSGGTAVGYALTYISSSRELVVSVESSAGVRRFFAVTDDVIALDIQDHAGSPVSIGITGVVGISTYYTIEAKIGATSPSVVINGVGSLPENYKLHFHRPSIINSSSHTWEYSGSGVDYNALPENGGKTVTSTEQVSELGGRVYASGTNELGDFKIGDFITAYNRTGNIVFNNKVSIGQLDSLRLSLSGGVAIEEFSTDIGLGDNEVGGPQNARVSTQLAVRTFLNNRLGNFIDKTISTNAIPSAIVQLNATGQINSDLIPPKVVNYYSTNISGGRSDLINQIPVSNLQSGDTVIEPSAGFVLISDLSGQYLLLSDTTRNYNYTNGFQVTGAQSAGGAIGIVTSPPSNAVGYGTTGLVKGVATLAIISNGGSGYTNPGVYTCFLDTSTGIGTSVRASVTVGGSGTITSINVNFGGRYYAQGDIVTVRNDALLGGRSGGSLFTATIQTVETRLYLQLINNQKFTGSQVLPDYIEDQSAVGISTLLEAELTKTFTPTDISIGGNVDFINNRIVVGLSSFTNGDPVVYSTNGGNVVSPLTSNGTYYIKRVGLSSVELYTNYGLNNILSLDSSGTGTHSLTRVGVTTADDHITFEKHGLSNGDAVRVSGNTPTGVNTGSFYYIGSVVPNAFTLHAIRSDAVSSINGNTFNAVGLGSTNTGTFTLTKQNVQYNSTVNTSSNILDNWSVLATSTIDAANITSGTITPSRLGSGNANTDTFLRGDSSYERVITSVGIGTTEPFNASASYVESAPGGIGISTYKGAINLSIRRTRSTEDTYSTLGVSKFKSSTFSVGNDGEITIKNSASGDVDAASLGGQAGAYYLNPANFTSSIPISKGGTGLSALPPNGALLQGNGTGYDLVTSPIIGGDLRLTNGGVYRAVGLAVTNATVTGIGSIQTLRSINASFTGITTFTAANNNIIQTAGTAALNRLVVTGVTTVSTLYFESLGGTSGASIPYLTNENTVHTGIVTFSGSGNHINCTSGTAVFNRAVFSGITTFLDILAADELSLNTSTITGTLTATNFNTIGVATISRINSTNLSATNSISSGISTFARIVQTSNTAALNQLTVAGVSTFTGQLNAGIIAATTISGFFDGEVLKIRSTDSRSTNSNPSTYTPSIQVDFKSNSTDGLADGGTYHGVLSWRSYGSSTDFSGGPMIQLAYTDNGNLYTRTSSSATAWNSWTKIWSNANDGSGSGLDADLLDGLELHTGRNNEANKVVRTDANGYIQAGWINSTSGTSPDSKPVRWYSSHDSYIRYMDGSLARMWLGLSYKTTYARRDSTTDTNYWIGTYGWGSIDLNTLFDYGCGFIDSWSNPTNQPTTATSHWTGIQSLHYTNATSRYGWQMVVGAGNPGLVYLRGSWGNTFTGWSKVWTDANDGAGSGLDADLLDGLNASATDVSGDTIVSRSGGSLSANQISSYGVTRSNNRIDAAERYPLGHYSQGEAVFEVDPTWSEAELRSYFNSNNVSWSADSTAPGGYAIYIDGAVNVGGEYGSGFPYIPVDTNDVYYMECYIKNVGTNQTHYMGSIDYNQSFTSLGGNPGSYGYWVMSNTNPSTAWTKVSGYITGFGSATGQFVAGTKYWTPQALFNYGVGTGTRACVISGWKVFRVSHFGNRTITGNFTASGTVTANSDIKLKTNIKPIENALEKVTKMRGVEFDRIDRDNEHQIGVIAQEIEEIIPEVVSDNFGTKAVAYGNISAVLIEAIKEQQNMINTLKQEIEDLKKK